MYTLQTAQNIRKPFQGFQYYEDGSGEDKKKMQNENGSNSTNKTVNNPLSD